MKIYNNLLSKDECEAFKSFWQKNKDSSYVNAEVDGQIIDRRIVITPEYKPYYDIVKRIVNRVFENTYDMWAAYQEQSFCHDIHIDDYRKEQSKHDRYTIILSMDTIPEFRTVVWRDECINNDELTKRVKFWQLKHKFSRRSNISEDQDLEHTINYNNDYFCDYLVLDDVYTYKQGGGAAFKATQLHCTSNWKKYPQFTSRQLLQIHTLADRIK